MSKAISGWAVIEGYVCQKCGDPARQNPQVGNSWGCARCKGATQSVALNFREAPAGLRAQYELVEAGPHRITIRDVGHSLGKMSVTNDVAAVVADLNSRGFLSFGRQVFYFDSEERLDEICLSWDTARLEAGAKFLCIRSGSSIEA